MSKYIKSFDKFLLELHAYDELEKSEIGSIRQEDWAAKDKIYSTINILASIIELIYDGQELDEEQIKLINTLGKKSIKLQQLINKREYIKNKQREDELSGIDNPNL